MTSSIDPTKPADGTAAVKSDLRDNLGAAKAEIEHSGFAILKRLVGQVAYSKAVSRTGADLISALGLPITAFDGVSPDDTNDQTVAIQAAIDAVDAETSATTFGSGAIPTLICPLGTFRVGELNPKNVRLLGHGRGTVFRYIGAGGLGTHLINHDLGGGALRVAQVLANMRLHGQSDSGADMCESLYFSDTATDLREMPNFANCWFTGAGLWAIDTLGATNLWIDACSLDRVGRGLVLCRQAPDRRGVPVLISGGTTLVWNAETADPLTDLDHWVPFLGAGSVGGKVAYWGACGVELRQGATTSGGGYFVHYNDCRVEWNLQSDLNGAGVVLDVNTSNADRVHEILLENVTGFVDDGNNQLVGFKGTDIRQPIVRALNSHLDGAARQIHDYTNGVSFGAGKVSQFDWMGGTYFAENGGPMIAAAASRPATALTINKAKGKSFLASDTGKMSVSDGSQWIDVT